MTQDRAEFESWWNANMTPYCGKTWDQWFDRDDDDIYTVNEVQDSWRAWQAAKASEAQQAEAEPVVWRDLKIGEEIWPGDRFLGSCGQWIEVTSAHLEFTATVIPQSRIHQRRVPVPLPAPAPVVPDDWFHALRDCLMAWNSEADEGDGIMQEHCEIYDKADALVGREMDRRGFLRSSPQPATVPEGYVPVPTEAIKEVIRISDRKHPAWDAVKKALSAAQEGSK